MKTMMATLLASLVAGLAVPAVAAAEPSPVRDQAPAEKARPSEEVYLITDAPIVIRAKGSLRELMRARLNYAGVVGTEGSIPTRAVSLAELHAAHVDGLIIDAPTGPSPARAAATSWKLAHVDSGLSFTP